MKRYDLELTAIGPVMEERSEGAFVPFSEVSGLVDTVVKMSERCTLLADLLREAKESAYFQLESPDSRLTGEEAGKLIDLQERIDAALAGKLPESEVPDALVALSDIASLQRYTLCDSIWLDCGAEMEKDDEGEYIMLADALMLADAQKPDGAT